MRRAFSKQAAADIKDDEEQLSACNDSSGKRVNYNLVIIKDENGENLDEEMYPTPKSAGFRKKTLVETLVEIEEEESPESTSKRRSERPSAGH